MSKEPVYKKLSQLKDVNISSISSTDLLSYDGTNFINKSPSELNLLDKNELFTLSATDISNKYITIAGTITDNQSIRLFVDNIGLKMEQGVDYSLSGNQIYWTGFNLQQLLVEGDKLQIIYI